jgi:hypothetical protein
LEFLPKRSDIKEIARPENGTSRIQSAVAHTFIVYAMNLVNFQTLKKYCATEIEFLKFHFQGEQLLVERQNQSFALTKSLYNVPPNSFSNPLTHPLNTAPDSVSCQ